MDKDKRDRKGQVNGRKFIYILSDEKKICRLELYDRFYSLTNQ